MDKSIFGFCEHKYPRVLTQCAYLMVFFVFYFGLFDACLCFVFGGFVVVFVWISLVVGFGACVVWCFFFWVSCTAGVDGWFLIKIRF